MNKYEPRVPPPEPEISAPANNVEPASCGGRRQLLFSPKGTIESPGFGKDFYLSKHSSDECFWLISAPPDTKIRVSFRHFNLRGQNDQLCYDDSLSLYEGRDNGVDSQRQGGVDLGKLLVKLCGSELPRPITSETNELLIGYSTTGGQLPRDHGFIIDYEQLRNLKTTPTLFSKFAFLFFSRIISTSLFGSD